MGENPTIRLPRPKGRPRKHPLQPGMRVGAGFRLTVELKRRLDQTVKLNGRSLTQEIELRLEQSFRDGEISARLDRLEASIKALGACLVALVDERRAA